MVSWNEWLTFPLKLSDLPKDAKLGITIWDSYGPGKSIPVGGTSLSIFGKHSTFRQGIYDLRIWPGVEADSGDGTPGKCDKGSKSARLNKVCVFIFISPNLLLFSSFWANFSSFLYFNS